MRRFVPILFSLMLAFAAPAAHAQYTGVDPLTVTVDPQYPAPYQAITITPTSTVVDLSASTVSISVNGTLVQKGSGTASAQAAVGAAGAPTIIDVSATDANGQVYKKEVVIRPADVALVVEPVSTTHPFYEGGALVASEGRVRLIAIPNLRTAGGTVLNPSTLVYNWRVDDQALQSSSGIGQFILSATAPVRYRDATVTVTVTSPDGSLAAQGQTTISPVDPIVRIYQSDPLLGPLFGNAIAGTVAMSDPEDTFRAVPYYFASVPSLAWSVNGSNASSDNEITVRPSGAGAGTAILGVKATQPGTVQTANTSISINFGAQKSLGIFGL